MNMLIPSSCKLTAVVAVLLVNGICVGQTAAADISVDTIVVKPAEPAPSALCQLNVRLKNSGKQVASLFKFTVKIGDREEPTYKQLTFVINVEPGKTGEIALYNFYSPSTPKPFDIQVTLVEAQWVQVKKEGEKSTTTTTGPVAGLPTGKSLTVNR
jgi:hypothetical protein